MVDQLVDRQSKSILQIKNKKKTKKIQKVVKETKDLFTHTELRSLPYDLSMALTSPFCSKQRRALRAMRYSKPMDVDNWARAIPSAPAL